MRLLRLYRLLIWKKANPKSRTTFSRQRYAEIKGAVDEIDRLAVLAGITASDMAAKIDADRLEQKNKEVAGYVKELLAARSERNKGVQWAAGHEVANAPALLLAMHFWAKRLLLHQYSIRTLHVWRCTSVLNSILTMLHVCPHVQQQRINWLCTVTVTAIDLCCYRITALSCHHADSRCNKWRWQDRPNKFKKIISI